MPIVVDWQAAGVGQLQCRPRVADLCRECGFRQLARRIEALTIKLGVAPSSSHRRHAQRPEPHCIHCVACDAEEQPNQKPLLNAGNLTTAASPEWKANYRTIATAADLDQLVRRLLEAQKRISSRYRNDLAPSAAGRDRRLFVRLGAGRGVLHSRPRAGRRAAARSGARSRRPAAGAGKSGHRKDRPEPQVRHDRAPRHRRRAARASRSTRWWPTTCSSRASGATTWTTWPAAT